MHAPIHRSIHLLLSAAALLPVAACSVSLGEATEGDGSAATQGSPTTGLSTSEGSGQPSTTSTTSAGGPSSTGEGTPTTEAPGSTTNTIEPTGTESGAVTSDSTATGSTSESSATSTTSATTDITDSTTGAPPVCPEDAIVCDGGIAQVCDGAGGFKSEAHCPVGCIPDVGCAECAPSAFQCMGDQIVQCNDAGTGFDVIDTCDGLQGLSCDPGLGACVGVCAGLGASYVGCDYYPTVLQQGDGANNAPTNEYAVAVANTSDQSATVTITRGAGMVTQVIVPAASVQVVVLPWVDELTKGKGPSVRVVDGAYRLRSTLPVTVYQYNPLHAAASNDASLLLPVNTWSGNYLVAGWQNYINNPGFYAVVASQDGTTVTLQPSATGNAVEAGAGVAADGTGVVMLDRGDVLQVISSGKDLTGTIVSADKPVQVFGGHECTDIPLDVAACDHLEESMFPIEDLAKEYVIAPPIQIPNDTFEKAQVVRVIASEANTTLVFTPDQPVAKLLANAGDFVELPVAAARFVVTADKKILVAQYMIGQGAGYGTSDPSMVLAVDPLHWRNDYLFHAPTTWVANYVDLIAPKNATVTVDGAVIGSWQAIGASDYQVAHVKLDDGGDGNHTVSGDVSVGISIYGVRFGGSYWYPGGLQ
ncbi:IgGFc-binding protein [Nannocystis sp. SCPEA4]|uniref:IgGFc-binding protein n=1 Tax=Nannocystis sp. SCPEA4 TaxID=2996787 RepID=UPI0022720A17|nr:IgGFc-binding protein [Nannocystis sp. SCPEA4]MCY1060029.1 IgGFc-binding protein [Nannocystis sp. SCPEA4]